MKRHENVLSPTVQPFLLSFSRLVLGDRECKDLEKDEEMVWEDLWLVRERCWKMFKQEEKKKVSAWKQHVYEKRRHGQILELDEHHHQDIIIETQYSTVSHSVDGWPSLCTTHRLCISTFFVAFFRRNRIFLRKVDLKSKEKNPNFRPVPNFLDFIGFFVICFLKKNISSKEKVPQGLIWRTTFLWSIIKCM